MCKHINYRNLVIILHFLEIMDLKPEIPTSMISKIINLLKNNVLLY